MSAAVNSYIFPKNHFGKANDLYVLIVQVKALGMMSKMIFFRIPVFHVHTPKKEGRFMQHLSITAEQKNMIRAFLEGYSMNKKLMRLDRYKKEFFGDDDKDDLLISETPLARASMFEVRHFILSLPNSDEKLFLYYHYVKGNSVPQCAELLGISERGAFRMKNRALAVAYYKKWGEPSVEDELG